MRKISEIDCELARLSVTLDGLGFAGGPVNCNKSRVGIGPGSLATNGAIL